MSRNETTIAHYTEFLNAKAATDPYGLYNTSMATQGNSAGIQRSGTSGSYSYSVIGSGDRPITHVSWFDAARFTNWIHNGQGSGDTETGAYTLVAGQTIGIAPAKNLGATVWIPTENEWFKAAYYDPTHMSGAGGYWLHANQSNSMTSNSPLTAGAANYYDGDYAVTQSVSYSSSQNYLTDAGAYGIDSQNYYGINDMAGNVWE
jgi:formylglycine-generating enzyme required for sulfatase activity